MGKAWNHRHAYRDPVASLWVRGNYWEYTVYRIQINVHSQCLGMIYPNMTLHNKCAWTHLLSLLYFLHCILNIWLSFNRFVVQCIYPSSPKIYYGEPGGIKGRGLSEGSKKLHIVQHRSINIYEYIHIYIYILRSKDHAPVGLWISSIIAEKHKKLLSQSLKGILSLQNSRQKT